MPNKKEGFKGISIKADLYYEIEIFVKENKSYRSIAEFVSEAIRLRLQELKPKVAT